MTQLQLTNDVLATVHAITGVKPKKPYNDRRVSFQRRYKLLEIGKLVPEQIHGIGNELRRLHPTMQFVVENIIKTTKFVGLHGQRRSTLGVTVKVF